LAYYACRLTTALKMKSKYSKFIEVFPETKLCENLSAYTSLKIGGKADLFYELREVTKIEPLINIANKLKIPHLILGGGSNIVFSEKGFRGLIIHIKASSISIKENFLHTDAGTLLSKLVQTSLQNNLAGMENLAGLPGTIGGAIRGNAGANGTEIKDILEEALLYHPQRGIHKEKNEYFVFSYRHSIVKEKPEIILSAKFRLKKVNEQEIEILRARIKELFLDRQQRQPAGKTSGSFFKNHSTEMPAGLLLDQSGCKGMRVGDAEISKKHANWIMNLGKARQKDVIKLAKMARKRVKRHFNIILEPEVQLVGTESFIDIDGRKLVFKQ
jgi:UDP-N-acetylmuramate dehydrogenase